MRKLQPSPRTAALRTLAIGTSVLAIALTQPAFAQTPAAGDPVPSDQVQPGAKPSGDGTNATFSGSADPQAASTPPVAGSAGGTSGVTGTAATPDAAPETNRDEIIVTGVRQSLANAQNIKRNADTIVDAITAQDIGSLPDRSVNEALQRVPGVTISRFAAPNDSQHFSAQGSGVVIRGLNYVRGEFNGRDTFAVGGGREIGFNDVPAEIVGSVAVFKNMTADLVEGGISGTVNINTRKPFDTKEDLLFLSASMNYGDLEQRGAPSAVALFSKQWNVGGGRIGALGSVTYSQFRSRADSVFTSSYLPRYNDDRNGNGVQDAGEGRVVNAGTSFQQTLFDTYPVPAGFNQVYVPLGGGQRTQSFDRERFALVGALQYENASGNLLVTGQFTRAESTEKWLERTEEPNVYYGDVTTVFPVGGVTPTYDEDGIFTSGRLGKRTGSVFGNLPNGGGYGALTQFAPDGIFNAFSNRYFYSKSAVQDHALNVKWEPTERLAINLDGQYIKSSLRARDDILDVGTFAQVNIDTRTDIPQISSYAPDRDINAYFGNPNSLYFRDAFNNRAINDGDEYAFRLDAEYDVSDESFLRKLKVGGRYAKRDQAVRTNDYNNWGYVSETWAANGPVTFAALQPGEFEVFGFDNFMRGKAPQPPASYYIAPEIIKDHDAFTALLQRVTQLGGGGYTPVSDDALASYQNSEETWAAYARVDFGADNIFGGDMSFSGNVGVRYVHTRDESVGALTFPQFNQIVPTTTDNPAPYQPNVASYCAYTLSRPNGQGTIPTICTVTAAQAAAISAFSNGAVVPDTASQSFDDWLPSLNLKLQVTPKLQTRFAASRAISRPNFGDLRNFIGVTPATTNTAGTFGFGASSRNPFLRPIHANQFDLSAEWYFAKVGSLTGTLFYKELTDIILDNAGFVRTLTNNGQTFDIAVTGPANVEGKGKVKGAEVAYQQTFDFLPGALRGLGVQATYTYVDASSISNGTPANGPADGSRPPVDVTGIYQNLPLAGLSKHTFNVAAFYDLGGVYTRFAYNWRSKFLLTQRDCCFPFLPVYSLANGTLDGSIFYTINRNFKIGLEAQNILDTTTKTTFVLNPDGLEAPRSFFKTDRSFTLSTRITF